MAIRITIPDAAVPHLLERANPDAVCETFLQDRRIPTVRLHTYGMWITRIFDGETGETVGHVVYWGNRRITVSRVEGEMDELIQALDHPTTPPDSDECLAIWMKVTGEANG